MYLLLPSLPVSPGPSQGLLQACLKFLIQCGLVMGMQGAQGVCGTGTLQHRFGPVHLLQFDQVCDVYV
jgi:hypothetical protein